MISKIGFIGAGKVGTSLGKYFSEKDIEISGYYSKTKDHSADSAAFTNSQSFDNLTDIVASCDALFITVPDGDIPAVWNQLVELDIRSKYIIHCSGAMSSKVFVRAEEKGAYGFSLHPMASVSDRKNSWQNLSNTYFTIEGDPKKIEDVMSIIVKTGNPISEIDADSKVKYHAAAVFFSNLVVGVAAAGQDIFKECGLPEDFINNAWKSLFIGNAENIVKNGLTGALTGPVERADHNTVEKHLLSLEGRNEIIYRELSRMILDVAREKHPERDYTNIDKELNK